MMLRVLTWPFRMAAEVIGWLLDLAGSMIGFVIGLVLCCLGVVLYMTGVGAILGVPMVILGGGLMLKSIF